MSLGVLHGIDSRHGGGRFYSQTALKSRLSLSLRCLCLRNGAAFFPSSLPIALESGFLPSGTVRTTGECFHGPPLVEEAGPWLERGKGGGFVQVTEVSGASCVHSDRALGMQRKTGKPVRTVQCLLLEGSLVLGYKA